MSRSVVAETTGKMPFAGKHLMKYLLQRGREASRNGGYAGKAAHVLAFGGFAALHAIQLKMGIKELSHDGHQNVGLVGIDAGYTVANAMATYTQAYLATKVLATRQEATAHAVTPEGFTADYNLHEEHSAPQLGRATPMELVVTLGGQALFLATMH